MIPPRPSSWTFEVRATLLIWALVLAVLVWRLAQ